MDLHLYLKRVDLTDHGIFGQLTTNQTFSCVTLERHDIDIPVGTYVIRLYDSPEHGTIPLLYDVPGRAWIEIHEGNWEFNSKGCILVGAKRDAVDSTMIDTSKVTLASLVNLCRQATSIDITIS